MRGLILVRFPPSTAAEGPYDHPFRAGPTLVPDLDGASLHNPVKQPGADGRVAPWAAGKRSIVLLGEQVAARFSVVSSVRHPGDAPPLRSVPYGGT